MNVFSDDNSSWESKVNFVDINNVFVGYDLEQQCCETAGWFVADRVMSDSFPAISEYDLEPYVFDKNFLEDSFSVNKDSTARYNDRVVFRLVAPDLPDLYLHLFNVHNGYYSHGFVAKSNDEVIAKGYL